MKALTLAVAMAAMLVPRVATADPAFDCSLAATADEQAICRSELLGRLDRRLSGIYRAIKACSGMQGQAIQENQSAWLVDRRKCRGSETCLARAAFSAVAAPSSALASSRSRWACRSCSSRRCLSRCALALSAAAWASSSAARFCSACSCSRCFWSRSRSLLLAAVAWASWFFINIL